MKKIPDSVLTEAERIYGQLGQGVASDVNAIAQALLARDQRAAEIARRKIVSGMYAGLAEWPDGEDIADAILTYDETQQ